MKDKREHIFISLRFKSLWPSRWYNGDSLRKTILLHYSPPQGELSPSTRLWPSRKVSQNSENLWYSFSSVDVAEQRAILPDRAVQLHNYGSGSSRRITTRTSRVLSTYTDRRRAMPPPCQNYYAVVETSPSLSSHCTSATPTT